MKPFCDKNLQVWTVRISAIHDVMNRIADELGWGGE